MHNQIRKFMSAYLKKIIAVTVFAISMGHGIDSYANNSSTDKEHDLPPVEVTWDRAEDIYTYFGWSDTDYQRWEEDINSESNDGGGGEYIPDVSNNRCSQLRETKPPLCPNPIPMPSGYAYGQGAYPGGSGLPKLMYWIDFVGGISPLAREHARRGLSLHTSDLLDEFVSFDAANQRLILSVQTACGIQNSEDQNNSFIIGISHMEQRCIEILERLQAEAGNPGFRGYFFSWLDREGIHLDDLGIPESILDYLSPSNSLTIKYNNISAEKKCARWWIDAQANQCTF